MEFDGDGDGDCCDTAAGEERPREDGVLMNEEGLRMNPPSPPKKSELLIGTRVLLLLVLSNDDIKMVCLDACETDSSPLSPCLSP